ncbi:MAG: hypothetical protein Q9178_004529 [Gyalolechia marmorata]
MKALQESNPRGGSKTHMHMKVKRGSGARKPKEAQAGLTSEISQIPTNTAWSAVESGLKRSDLRLSERNGGKSPRVATRREKKQLGTIVETPQIPTSTACLAAHSEPGRPDLELSEWDVQSDSDLSETDVLARVRRGSGARRLREAQLGISCDSIQTPTNEACPSDESSLAEGRRSDILGSLRKGTARSLEAAQVRTVSATAQIQSPVVVIVESDLSVPAVSSSQSTSGYVSQGSNPTSAPRLPRSLRSFDDNVPPNSSSSATLQPVGPPVPQSTDPGRPMAEPKDVSVADSDLQVADLFPRPTVIFIINRQHTVDTGNACPLVIVKNGDERPDQNLLCNKAHELYMRLQAKGEPWIKIRAIPKNIEASIEIKMCIAAGLNSARDMDRAAVFKLCFPQWPLAKPAMTIKYQMEILQLTRYDMAKFRSRRRSVRSDASDFEEEENDWRRMTQSFGAIGIYRP